MNKSNKFSSEVCERAVRMVLEQRGEYSSLWAAVESVAPKIGCVPQTLLEWFKLQEIDAGMRPGVTTAEMVRIKELERENKAGGHRCGRPRRVALERERLRVEPPDRGQDPAG